MISQDKGQTTIEGNPSVLVSEIGALIHFASKNIAEATGIPYESILIDVHNAAAIYPLLESGMTQIEAMEVLGITDMVEKTIKHHTDGTTEITYEKDK